MTTYQDIIQTVLKSECQATFDFKMCGHKVWNDRYFSKVIAERKK